MNITLVNPSAEIGELAFLQTHFDVRIRRVADPVDADADLILFDATIGEDSVLAQSRLLGAGASWVVINQGRGPHQTLKYIRAGAAGVLKGADAIALQDCIKKIDRGGICLDPDMMQLLAMRQIRKILAPFDILSSREFDVFCLLAEGYPVAYIAEHLGISTKTAFNCQALLRKKLGLGNQAQITHYAKQHGLI